jgi:hypothetical protein
MLLTRYTKCNRTGPRAVTSMDTVTLLDLVAVAEPPDAFVTAAAAFFRSVIFTNQTIVHGCIENMTAHGRVPRRSPRAGWRPTLATIAQHFPTDCSSCQAHARHSLRPKHRHPSFRPACPTRTCGDARENVKHPLGLQNDKSTRGPFAATPNIAHPLVLTFQSTLCSIRSLPCCGLTLRRVFPPLLAWIATRKVHWICPRVERLLLGMTPPEFDKGQCHSL